jgi:hypothetical protein
VSTIFFAWENNSYGTSQQYSVDGITSDNLAVAQPTYEYIGTHIAKPYDPAVQSSAFRIMYNCRPAAHGKSATIMAGIGMLYVTGRCNLCCYVSSCSTSEPVLCHFSLPRSNL